MTEPLATVGAIAAVSQLTGELVKLTTNLRHHLKVMRRAPHEVQCFLMETSNFTCLLNSFTELAARPVRNMEKREQRKREKMISEVEQQCAYVRDKMEYLVDRFAMLAKEDMTPLEGLLERIKYLLDKPDIRDLRLSLQIAALTVNSLSTLFAWEEAAMKDEARTASLLEQLKNLLPMAKKASIELAEYQRKHGTNYESGMPDPNNAMLAASEEIQRQIAHAIRPYSHPEGPKRRSERRRKSQSPVVSRTSHRESWSSPFGPNGMVAGSVEHLPRRNRVSFKTLEDRTADQHSSDHSIGARHDDDITPAAKSRESKLPAAKPPSPVINGASYVSEQDLDGISFDKVKQAQVDELFFENNDTEAHHDLQPQPSREDRELDKSDQTNPRTHQCNRRCTYVNCPLCSELHCSHEQCPSNNQTNYTYQPNPPNQPVFKGKPANYNHKINKKNNKINIPLAVSPLPSEPQTARNSTENLPRFPPATEATHYTLPAPTESEDNSGVSDSDREMEGPHWSRNDLALPSSKSSSPSTHGQGGHRRRRRSSAAVRPVENGADLKKGVSDISGEKHRKKGQVEDRIEQEREQRGDLGYEAQRRRRQRLDGLDGLDKRPSEKGQGQGQPGSAVPRTLEDREVSWGERPSLYMPETPSRGPSGRRRPRRPPPAALVL